MGLLLSVNLNEGFVSLESHFAFGGLMTVLAESQPSASAMAGRGCFECAERRTIYGSKSSQIAAAFLIALSVWRSREPFNQRSPDRSKYV